jgi:TolA-binding protein
MPRPQIEAAETPHPTSRAPSRKQRSARPIVVSTLAAEVSRIDTARTAISVGDYEGAMQLIARYHADFPEGALAADADVVALEAATARGDRAEVARRAKDFLSRYPHDPHAARVRGLFTRY